MARSNRLIAEAFAGLGSYTEARQHTVQARDLFASIHLNRDAEKMGTFIERFDNVIALHAALKGAHFPTFVGQIARDKATHDIRLPAGLLSDLIQGGAFRSAQ